MASGLPRDEQRAIGRQHLQVQLEQARRDEERARVAAERLRVAIRAARSGGIPVVRIAELTGMTRPGVYDVLNRTSSHGVEGLDDLVVATIAAMGGASVTVLAERLGVPEVAVAESVRRLASDDSLLLAAAGYGEDLQQFVLLGPLGLERLTAQIARESRPRGRDWAVYFEIDSLEAAGLERAARARFGERTAVLPVGTLRAQTAPELAVALPASDLVDAMNQAAAAWQRLRDDVDLPATAMRVAAVIPPATRSGALDAFVAGLLEGDPELYESVHRLLPDLAESDEDREIAIRALTEGATALRRSLDHPEQAPVLDSGDAAFAEWTTAAHLRLDPDRERIQEPLVAALDLATERLGPFPGGRLGHFKPPDGVPKTVPDVEPSDEDLHAIALLAGTTVGRAHARRPQDADIERILPHVASGR
ncbi:hypothetical protein OJ997_21530 [Solirubrobacter phytolaccae]|uniref:Uncharacterized protein n=1 Tax=Solirubrobacter phytolaccae TaxID=1404360 RepID=A0A9X3NAK1_9ACTN|nr:hypothetical protein [Solirubrobacter phytolaccae]MDA0182908.1 hypothetical protein [Solirubrobacter phytolaccae]